MSDDRSYFYDRAEAEIKAAQEAQHPKAVSAHYILAGFYLDLTYNELPDSSAPNPRESHDAAG